MSAARLPPLVLAHGQHGRASRSERWAASILGVVLVGGFLAIMVLVLGDVFDQGTLERLAGKFREAPERFLEFLAVPIVAAVHLWIMRRTTKYERVFLDDTGIRYQSPLPGFLRSLRPDWSLQWSQLRELRIAVPKAMFHPNLVFLEFDAGPVKRKLQALHWGPTNPGAKAEVPEEPLSWRERFFAGSGSARERERTLREAEQSAIVRYAKQAGVKVTTGPMRQTGFALESNRHTLAATVLGLGLLAYAILDFAIYDESYAVDPPLVLFALGGAIAALAGMLWLAFAGAPRAEALGLALLLGGATAFALYPGALRLNELTDFGGLQTYDYRLTQYSVFEPVDPRLPALDFSNYSDYWRQFKLGSTHRFELRQGGLGFYQVNMAPVRARMRAYFRGEK